MEGSDWMAVLKVLAVGWFTFDERRLFQSDVVQMKNEFVKASVLAYRCWNWFEYPVLLSPSVSGCFCLYEVAMVESFTKIRISSKGIRIDLVGKSIKIVFNQLSGIKDKDV